MLKKVKELFYRWYNIINQFSEDGCYIRAIFTFILPPIVIGLLIGLITKGIMAGFNFLYGHATQLVMVALGLWLFAAWWDKHRAERFQQEQVEREQEERNRYMARKEYAATKDATYTEQAKILFDVAREIGGLGIIPPMRLSNLYSPSRTIPKLNGEVILCQYLLEKDREVVDVELVKQTLQTKVNQRLMAGEFPGVPETHTYRGRTCSGFVIDSVRDGEGYLEVYTAFGNNAYCRYKERRDLNRDLMAPPVDRRDIDY